MLLGLREPPDNYNGFFIKVLWLFLFIFVIFELFINRSVSFLLKPGILAGLTVLLALTVLTWKRKYARMVSYVLIIAYYIFFFFLIDSYPLLICFFFMWFGLLLSVTLNSYPAIFLAGFFSIVLTIYSFLVHKDRIFPGLENGDIVYLLMFAVFLIIFLLLNTRFTRILLLQAKQGQEQLKTVLDSMDMATWSYEVHSKKCFVSQGIQKMTGLEADCFIENRNKWINISHPYDIFRVKQAWQEMLSGEKKIVQHRLMLSNGEIRWVQIFAVPVRDIQGELSKIDGLIIDITGQKQSEEKIKHMAYHDTLTGLPNRAMFYNYFHNVLAGGKYIEQEMAIVFIDLDHFKAVNDNLGHDIGDLLLQAVAGRLKTALRETDVLARMGGDEFLALLTGIRKEDAVFIAQRILQAMDKPFAIAGNTLVIGASIGISMFPEDGRDIESLIKNADQAMYRVKEKGKNNFEFFLHEDRNSRILN